MFLKIKKISVFGILLFFLTGCFEILEEVNFNKDGSGQVTLTLNFSRSKTKLNSIKLLDSINGYKIPSEKEIEKQFAKITKTIKASKGITNVSNSLNFDDYIFTISCDFNTVNALNTVISNFSSKSEAAKIKNQKHFSYDKHTHTFTRNYHYDLVKEFKKINATDREIFNNASVTTIYRFQEIIKSSKNKTAKISGNKKALFLRIDAQDILSNKNTIKNQIKLQN